MTVGTPDGDTHFIGINSTLDRAQLQAGMLSRGENTRLRKARCAQREGTSQPDDFNPGFQSTFYGSTVYRNPNGDEVLLIAPTGVTYTISLQYGKDPVQINYSAAEIATGHTNGINLNEFVQAFDKVILLRYIYDPSYAPLFYKLIWDGINGHNWEIMTLSPEGLKLVPPSTDGEPFMDRVIYYTANAAPDILRRDTWAMSDVEDATSYDDIFQSFRTNPSESDYITRIMAYFKGSVLIFKNQSIHMATLNNTFPVSISQRILNSSIGSVGKKMPLMVGGDVIFLSKPNGFYRLSEVIADQITTLPVPISEGIQAVIDRIDWTFTEFYGCSAVLGNLAFFGVSLKGTGIGRLNAVLVYDTERRQWESAPDTWRDPTFGFSRLHVTNYQGVHRVFAVDYPTSTIYLLYEGLYDELKSGIFSVPFVVDTRGYTGGDPLSIKRFIRLKASISTFAPSLSITALSDGYNEAKLLTPTPITKNRTRFYTHGHKTFDPATDDPDEPKREDYSQIIDTAVAIEDFEDLSDGPISSLPGSGIVPVGNRQQSNERYLVRVNGKYVALRFENNDGLSEILGVAVEMIPSVDNVRVFA